MNKLVPALCVIASLAGAVRAQPVTPVAPALDSFLEQRVAEELAADGTLLSRLGVALDVELVGDKAIISLVDSATRRPLASTKLDAVPADRDAAVAAVTQVAANLAAQLSAATSSAAAAVQAVLEDERAEREARERAERAERDAREQAELRYRQEALSFGSEIAVHSNGKTTTTSRTVVAFQGEERRRLEGRDMYLALDREDLAEAYSRRVAYGWVGFIGGTAALSAGIVLFGKGTVGTSDCELGTPGYAECDADYEASRAPLRTYGLLLGGAGLVGALVGFYFRFNTHPIGESEIYDLGAEHNARLRQKYGLPAPERRTQTRRTSPVVAPYVLGDGAGLSVAGRF